MRNRLVLFIVHLSKKLPILLPFFSNTGAAGSFLKIMSTYKKFKELRKIY
jgi:hypothetical protein